MNTRLADVLDGIGATGWHHYIGDHGHTVYEWIDFVEHDGNLFMATSQVITDGQTTRLDMSHPAPLSNHFETFMELRGITPHNRVDIERQWYTDDYTVIIIPSTDNRLSIQTFVTA